MMGVGLIPSLFSSTEKYFEKHNQKKTPRKYCVSEVPLFSLLLQTLFLHFHYYNFPLFTMSNAARLLEINTTGKYFSNKSNVPVARAVCIVWFSEVYWLHIGELVHRLVSVFVACFASVSNRVIARVITPPPPLFLFFCFRPNFLD